MATLLSANLAYERRLNADGSLKVPKKTTTTHKQPVPALRMPEHGVAGAEAPEQVSGRKTGRAVVLPDLQNSQSSSTFPPKLSARDQPSLLAKLEKLIKDSGLFPDDMWEEAVDGEITYREPSRARLDILRVVFAIFCDSTKLFRPILCMIQREYEAHVNIAYQAEERADSLQKDLTTGYDSRQAAFEEMKSRWKERLKRAHDAVTETKRNYDELRERFDVQAQRIALLEEENVKLREETDNAVGERQYLLQQNMELQKQVKAHDFELQHINKVESERMVQDEQINVLTHNVAEMKTNHEMQELKYQNVVKEHGKFKAEIRHMKDKMREFHEVRKGLSPRPEWPRITQFIAPLTLLPIAGSSARVARRIVTDLQHALFMQRFAVLSQADGFCMSAMTAAFQGGPIKPTAPEPLDEAKQEEEHQEQLQQSAVDALMGLGASGRQLEPPPQASGRSSAAKEQAGRQRRASVSSEASDLQRTPSTRKGKGRRKSVALAIPLVKACPGLGTGSDVPTPLQSASAVPIVSVSGSDLATVMSDFWEFRAESNSNKDASSAYSMADAFWAFLKLCLPSEQAALEASYSIAVALAEARGHDSEANLFFLCLLGRVDENCVHVHREIRHSCRQWTGHIEGFINFLAFKHPWIHLVAARLRQLAAALEGPRSRTSRESSISYESHRAPSTEGFPRKAGGPTLLAEETRDALVENVLELHVESRRRLMQRFRNGLARATMFSLLDMGKPATMVQELVEPMLKELEPTVDAQDVQTLVNVGLSRRMYKENLTPAQLLRISARSLQPFHKFLGAAHTLVHEQAWMTLDELDHAINDPRVSHLMQNFLRYLTPGNAAPVNRVLEKLEAAV